MVAIVESPIDMIEGEIITYTVTWEDAISLSSPTAIVYRRAEDITSTVMASGSHSVSGNVQTLKPITAIAGDGGSIYVVDIQVVVDGLNTEIRKLLINILKDKEGA